MFCIFSKSKNSDQPIAYFDTVEKAQAIMPPDATDWYVKDIGDLKTFMSTFKAERKNTNYVTKKSEEPVNIKTEKIDIYDTNDNLQHHLFTASVKKNNIKEEIVPDEFDKELESRPVLSAKQAQLKTKHTEAIHYYKTTDIKINKPKIVAPVKKYVLPPTEENGKNVFRYSFDFYDENSTPKITKSFDKAEETDTFRRVCFLKGYIYENKAFTIVVYEHTKAEAEKLMKERLKELKKEFKAKGL